MMNNDGDEAAATPSGVMFGGMVLDRKKMEEERLARSKRRREASDGDGGANTGSAHASKKAKSGDDDVLVVEKSTMATRPVSSSSTSRLPPSTSTNQATSIQQQVNHPPKAQMAEAPTDNLPFRDGVVRRTFVKGYPRQPDDITIDEILQKDMLKLAIISSFQWDDEWLLSKINLRWTRMMLVAYAADERTKADMRENAPPNTRFCFPPMGGWGIMHSKLQLLKFANHMRIVVPTANMVPYDWGETGVMENMVFIIDLPRLADPDTFVPTEFAIELCRFLTALTIDEGIVRSLSNYDFSRTKDLAFVHSIAGRHEGDEWRYTGYTGLATALQSLGLATQSTIDLECVASSIGSLNDGFVTALYESCQGKVGVLATARKKNDSPLADHMRIYFPTHETVGNSRGGKESGGTLCFQRDRWESSKFPRHLMRDSTSTRPGLLLHTKAILARPSTPTLSGGSGAWAYIGSANVSEGAWGKLVKDKSGRERLCCYNWECGVVVPMDRGRSGVTVGSAATTTATTTATTAATTATASVSDVIVIDDDDDDLEAPYGNTTTTTAKPTTNAVAAAGEREPVAAVFADTIPLPIKFPGPRYANAGPGSHPWFRQLWIDEWAGGE